MMQLHNHICAEWWNSFCHLDYTLLLLNLSYFKNKSFPVLLTTLTTRSKRHQPPPKNFLEYYYFELASKTDLDTCFYFTSWLTFCHIVFLHKHNKNEVTISHLPKCTSILSLKQLSGSIKNNSFCLRSPGTIPLGSIKNNSRFRWAFRCFLLQHMSQSFPSITL